ncbi:MAG: hypothetical protein AB7N65_02460, partial [Vicinamibacterales bacterium]
TTMTVPMMITTVLVLVVLVLLMRLLSLAQLELESRNRAPSGRPTPRACHRRVIVIWPLANAPEHEFEPLYVPVIVIVVRLTCAVPVAREEHPGDIMLLVGMSIVNVMSSPDIVPTKDPAIRPGMPEPEKLIGPVTVDPFCVSCQVIVPMSV